MRIYRFECPETGNGPWNAGGTGAYNAALFDLRQVEERGYHVASQPPCPWDEHGTHLKRAFDCSRDDTQPYFFGFNSKAQLVRWFQSAEGRKAMGDAGIRLRIYECSHEDVVHGRWQVAFVKANARIVGELDPATLSPLPN